MCTSIDTCKTHSTDPACTQAPKEAKKSSPENESAEFFLGGVIPPPARGKLPLLLPLARAGVTGVLVRDMPVGKELGAAVVVAVAPPFMVPNALPEEGAAGGLLLGVYIEDDEADDMAPPPNLAAILALASSRSRV